VKNIRFVGLDVHAETVAVAVAESDGEVRSLGMIPNRPESIRKLVKKLGPARTLRVCYEAGPCGYVLYWQLTEMGVPCDVIAPTLVPVKSGDRIKTDRRDAQKLARCYRAGDLTPVWVPDEAHEALRDLVRAREAAKKDQLRARHRLQKLLLRRGLRPPDGIRTWTPRHLAWVKTLHLTPAALDATLLDYVSEVDHANERVERLERAIDQAIEAAPAQIRAVIEGLQSLRGVARISAATIVAEVGMLSRFRRPKQLMGYTGAVSREHSSGERIRRGAITKTGNAHLRRILIEGGVGVSAPPQRRRRTAAAPGERERGGEGDRLEGAAPVALPLRKARRARQAQAAGGDGGGPRARWLCLGDRRRGGKAASLALGPRSVEGDTKWSRADSGRASRGKEDPRSSYATGPRPRLARLVRGSSRRITTMTASLALDPRISE
jgi:transposase